MLHGRHSDQHQKRLCKPVLPPENGEIMKKSKRKQFIRAIITVISVLGFLVCTVVLMYPVISDKWNRYRDSQLIAAYNEMIKNGDPATHEQELKEASAYNKTLYMQGRNIVTDAEYDPDQYYESILNTMNNGLMCYIEIPVIDVLEPVYHYSNEISLGIGVGHIHGSSLPVGGKSTHSLLTGHRGLPNQKFFSDLDQLKNGDNFYIHIYGHTLAYQVFRRDIVLPGEVDGLFIEQGKDLVTLVTCEPYGVNTHRLLVTGKRIPFAEKENVKDGKVTTGEHRVMIDPSVWVLAGFTVFILLLLIFGIIRHMVRKKRRKKRGGSA